MKIVNTQRAITPKVDKPELPFMCSACCLLVFKNPHAHLQYVHNRYARFQQEAQEALNRSPEYTSQNSNI